MTTHSGEKNFSCDLCGVKFQRQVYVNRHKKFKHPEIAGGERRFACEFCGDKFNRGHHLKYHRQARHAAEIGLMKEENTSLPSQHREVLDEHPVKELDNPSQTRVMGGQDESRSDMEQQMFSQRDLELGVTQQQAERSMLNEDIKDIQVDPQSFS